MLENEMFLFFVSTLNCLEILRETVFCNVSYTNNFLI